MVCGVAMRHVDVGVVDDSRLVVAVLTLEERRGVVYPAIEACELVAIAELATWEECVLDER